MKAKYLIPMALLVSCTLQTRLERSAPAAGVSHPPKADKAHRPGTPPPLRVEYRGDSVYLVETETVDGDTLLTLQAATVNVISEVRNVAERCGELRLAFRVTVPRTMPGTSREILLYPTLGIRDTQTVLSPICIRGRTMDILQSREYWQLYRYHVLFPRDTAILGAKDHFVIFPYTEDARLDSITSRRREITLLFTETISSENMPRRINLTVPGKIYGIDGTEYTVPPRDTIGYLISSMTEFIDTVTRHRIRIVDRNVAVETRSHIAFLPGKHILSDSVGNNRAEFEAITEQQRKIRELWDLELDSILITATASPEGAYKNNEKLSLLRGQAVADSLFDQFHPIIHTMPENWNDLKDSLRAMHLVRGKAILSLLETESDPDAREKKLRERFPEEYALLRKNIYPALRIVSVRYCMHRTGMIKDTVHLREVDSAYMAAVEDLRGRRYSKALSTLLAYGDRNTAIAYMSMGYDRAALKIMAREKESDIREYLMAILCSRLGMVDEARMHYLNSCRLNGAMEFRGNLDPEITKILKQ